MVTPSFRLALTGAVVLLGACGTRGNRRVAAPPPSAEFLVATQDSTFWVRTDPAGIRVRGAPITLARFDDHFYEIFLTDDDRSYENALLVGLRLYRRDLTAGDSVIVFEDTIVPRMAREYGRAHPSEHPLGPDEDGSDDPPMQALADLDIVGVHGPYLSYEYHVDVTNRGAEPWHATRRGVIDLRSGRSLGVADFMAAPAAKSLLASGKRELSRMVDSLRAESRDGRVARSVTDFRFDDRSFVLTVPDSQPAIEFDVPQRGVDAPDDVFALDPLAFPEPPWWPTIAADFPRSTDELDRWPRIASNGYDLLARYDSSGENAQLSLTDHKREWPVRVVAAPILQVFWLDKPAIDGAQRRALSRAFDEASLYDETTRTVRDARPRPLSRAPLHAPRA